MKRKQKTLPWRRFGYLMLITIKFDELFLWISSRIINGLRSYIKHSEGGFIRHPKTSKSPIKKTRLRLGFATHFSVFGPSWWNTLPRVWYITYSSLHKKQSANETTNRKTRLYTSGNVFHHQHPIRRRSLFRDYSASVKEIKQYIYH